MDNKRRFLWDYELLEPDKTDGRFRLDSPIGTMLFTNSEGMARGILEQVNIGARNFDQVVRRSVQNNPPAIMTVWMSDDAVMFKMEYEDGVVVDTVDIYMHEIQTISFLSSTRDAVSDAWMRVPVQARPQTANGESIDVNDLINTTMGITNIPSFYLT